MNSGGSMSAIVTKSKKMSYFREVQNELKKVTWTSKEELLLCTKVVMIATVICGFAIYIVDLAVRGLLDLAGVLVRMVIG